MACPCASYTRIYVDPCDNPLVLTQIVADETGTWTAQIEFNGMTKCALSFEVVNGDPISFPNVLNEVYTHEMRVFRSDGSLVGCYWIGGPAISQSIVCGDGHIISEIGEYITSEAGSYLVPEVLTPTENMFTNPIISELADNIFSELDLQLISNG